MWKYWPILLILFAAACSGRAQQSTINSAKPVETLEHSSKKTDQPKKVAKSATPEEQKSPESKKNKKKKKKGRRRPSQKKAASKPESQGPLKGKALQKRINKYAFVVHRVFSRHWVAPSLDDETLNGLRTVVHLRFDQGLKIASYSIKKSSKNEIFDDSVRLAAEALINLREQQPEPPEEIRESISRFGMVMRVNGKDAVNDW